MLRLACKLGRFEAKYEHHEFSREFIVYKRPRVGKY